MQFATHKFKHKFIKIITYVYVLIKDLSIGNTCFFLFEKLFK